MGYGVIFNGRIESEWDTVDELDAGLRTSYGNDIEWHFAEDDLDRIVINKPNNILL